MVKLLGGEGKISVDRLWLLFDNTPMRLLATLVNAIVIAIIFSSVIDRTVVEAWLLSMLGVMAFRYVLFLKFKQKIDLEYLDKKWVGYYTMGLLANSFVWAMSVPLFFPQSPLSDQLLLSFVLGGMVAGSLSVSAYHFYMYALYNIPILFVLMVYVFFSGNYYFGWMIILFMMISLANAKRMHDKSLKVMQLQESNDELIASLVKEKDAVKNALDEATKANGLKDLFIGNISHEFRTPLNAIQGFSQVLQAQPDMPESVVPMLKKINASGNQILSLVDVLMQYSKYKSGALEYSPTQGILQQVALSLVTQERVRLLEKNVEFKVDFNDNNIIEADFVMLKFVLNVFIEDALENASENTVIEISGALVPEGKYEVRVCNQGKSLEEEEASHMFDPFEKMVSNYESRNLAKGLGFYIAKGLIEEFHHGTIAVENGLEEGYCVLFTLPQVTP